MMKLRPRFHRGNDGWGRGSYSIPGAAVLGASDCGMWSDSPAPSNLVRAELRRFAKVLGRVGIPSRTRFSRSGNIFMAKRWLCVWNAADFDRAAALADKWLAKHDRDLRYAHDARGEVIPPAEPKAPRVPRPPKAPPAPDLQIALPL